MAFDGACLICFGLTTILRRAGSLYFFSLFLLLSPELNAGGICFVLDLVLRSMLDVTFVGDSLNDVTFVGDSFNDDKLVNDFLNNISFDDGSIADNSFNGSFVDKVLCLRLCTYLLGDGVFVVSNSEVDKLDCRLSRAVVFVPLDDDALSTMSSFTGSHVLPALAFALSFLAFVLFFPVVLFLGRNGFGMDEEDFVLDFLFGEVTLDFILDRVCFSFTWIALK